MFKRHVVEIAIIAHLPPESRSRGGIEPEIEFIDNQGGLVLDPSESPFVILGQGWIQMVGAADWP